MVVKSKNTHIHLTGRSAGLELFKRALMPSAWKSKAISALSSPNSTTKLRVDAWTARPKQFLKVDSSSKSANWPSFSILVIVG